MAQMTDIAGKTSSGGDQLAESLGRLSKKPGVKATIVLDRSSGAILTTTGTFSSSRSSSSSSQSQGLNPPPQSTTDDSNGGARESQGVEEMASMVWNFVNAAGGMVQGLDTEDELKLLRLRTKKHELVIVPDAKYLLIAVHETATTT